MKIDMVIYYAGSGGLLHEEQRFKCSSLEEARKLLLEWYWLEIEHLEWNLRSNYYGIAAYEAHIYGYSRDEHIMLTLEDRGQSRVMEIYNELKQQNFVE